MNYEWLITHFGKPKSKIDFIKLGLPATLSRADALRLHSEIKGRIDVPERWRTYKDDWITIHDPTFADLQLLVNEYYETEIIALEVAVDFKLKDGSNDPERLRALHTWLKVCLFPQRHKRLKGKGRRRYFDETSGTIETDMLKTRSTDKTVYWASPEEFEQVRLYIKEKDYKKPIEEHSVRIEATLYRGGCQKANVHRVGLLPVFGKELRRYLSPFFNVSNGIKPKIKRTRIKDPKKAKMALIAADKERVRVERNWNKYGAAWAAKHGYHITPDTKTNCLTGAALKGLRESLMRLSVPEKVADWDEWVAAKKSIYLGVEDIKRGEL